MGKVRFGRGLGFLLLALSLVSVVPGFAQETRGSQRPGSLTGGPHQQLPCTACHGPETRPMGTDPSSPLARKNIATTCGNCHSREKAAYADSSHGRGVARGEAVAPTCVSCHGGHGIRRVAEAAAPTSPTRVVLTCAECHEDPAVLRVANLPYAAVERYEETFHGIAQAHGITEVATCVSCHGAHEVLPASDARSRVHSANLETTCRGCHAAVTPAMLAAGRHPAGQRGFWEILDQLRVYFPTAGTAVNALLVSGMGALVGCLSGLFGVGGGFLMTPLLIFIGISPAVAAATDAAQITAGASSGALSHSRLGNVDYKMGLVIV